MTVLNETPRMLQRLPVFLVHRTDDFRLEEEDIAGEVKVFRQILLPVNRAPGDSPSRLDRHDVVLCMVLRGAEHASDSNSAKWRTSR